MSAHVLLDEIAALCIILTFVIPVIILTWNKIKLWSAIWLGLLRRKPNWGAAVLLELGLLGGAAAASAAYTFFAQWNNTEKIAPPAASSFAIPISIGLRARRDEIARDSQHSEDDMPLTVHLLKRRY